MPQRNTQLEWTRHGLIGSGALIAALLACWTTAPAAQATALFENTFLSSSTGTNVIQIGDTIAFETFVTIQPGVDLAGVYVSFTGDIDGALNDVACSGSIAPICFPETANLATGWTRVGAGTEDVTTLGVERISGAENEFWLEPFGGSNLPLGGAVFGGIGVALGNRDGTRYQGNGIRTLIGTLTVTATSTGQFNAGTLLYPGIDGVLTLIDDPPSAPTIVEVDTTVMGGAYTVVPEPGTALLLAAGLVGLAARGRPTH